MSEKVILESINDWLFEENYYIFENFSKNLFTKKVTLTEDIKGSSEKISNKLKDSIESNNFSKIESVMKKVPKVKESKLEKMGKKIDSNFSTYVKESEKQLKTTSVSPKLHRSLSFALAAGAAAENKKGKDWKKYITDKIKEVKIRKDISGTNIALHVIGLALYKVFILPILLIPIAMVFGNIGIRVMLYGFIILAAKVIFDDIFEIKKEKK